MFQNKKIPSEVNFILNRLHSAGHEVYIVGGAIRDWLLNKEIQDWDFATSASSKEIKEIFRDKTIFSLKHETVTIVLKGKNYEITPFKGDDIIDDLLHRDFTINAIAYDPVQDLIIDPVSGRKDIEKKIIRATLNPYERFSEDHLRMLRGIRFLAELGFRIEKKTRDAIKQMAHLIEDISKERIRDELLKLLIAPYPSHGIRLMHRLGLMEYIIPEFVRTYGVRQNKYHKYTVFNHTLLTLDIIESEPLLRLAALFHDIGKPATKKRVKGKIVFHGHDKESAQMAKEIMKRLKFSNDTIEDVYMLVKRHMLNYSPEWSDAAIRRLITSVGKRLIYHLLCLRKADLMAHGTDKENELKLLKELKRRIKKEIEKGFAFDLKDLNINGHIIMKELDIPPGPEVGKILRSLYKKVIENPELNKTDILISLAKEIKDFHSTDEQKNK